MYNKVQSKALIIITLLLNTGKGVICRLSCRWLHNCDDARRDLRLLQSTRRSTKIFKYYLSYDAFGIRSASLRWFVRSFLQSTLAYDAFGKLIPVQFHELKQLIHWKDQIHSWMRHRLFPYELSWTGKPWHILRFSVNNNYNFSQNVFIWLHD